MAGSIGELLRAEAFSGLIERGRDVFLRWRLQPTSGMDYISPAIERIMGYAPDEFYTDPLLFTRLIHRDDQAKLAKLFEADDVDEALGTPTTLRWLTKDGRVVWMEQIAVTIADQHGKIVAVETLSRDVTDKIALEQRARQHQKLEALGRLAGGIAHDFNNLLGVILGYGQLLSRRLGHEHAESLAAIFEAGERGVALTKQLLSFSRGASENDGPIGLDVAIEEARRVLAHLVPESVALETRLAAAGAAVPVGRGQLDQILVNLVLNARDAMPRDGTITIETSRAGGSVRLVVRDDGAGMDEPTRARLFEPRFTTTAEGDGSGLGLSVVHEIVKQTRGRIEVDLAPGAGASVRIDWPTSNADNPEVLLPVRTPRAAADRETVLVVEDEPILRRLLQEILREHGYRVLTAGCAAEARAASAAEPGPIALLLTDVVMPGESGRVLADQLQTRRRELRVLYISGYNEDEVLRQGVSRHRVAFVAKPFTEEQLLAEVQRALG